MAHLSMPEHLRGKTMTVTFHDKTEGNFLLNAGEVKQLKDGVNTNETAITALGLLVTGITPTVQSADPTSASAEGWYLATGSGDLFFKSAAGLFTIAGSYAADA